jgi:hypothetical protein
MCNTYYLRDGVRGGLQESSGYEHDACQGNRSLSSVRVGEEANRHCSGGTANVVYANDEANSP